MFHDKCLIALNAESSTMIYRRRNSVAISDNTGSVDTIIHVGPGCTDFRLISPFSRGRHHCSEHSAQIGFLMPGH
jgi:hypothetical protein